MNKNKKSIIYSLQILWVSISEYSRFEELKIIYTYELFEKNGKLTIQETIIKLKNCENSYPLSVKTFIYILGADE